MQPCEQGDTGVDVGSNETASPRTSAGAGRPERLRGRFLAARGLTAGLLVAVAALLTLPLQVQAQTTLVSNMGQTTPGAWLSRRLRPSAGIHHGQPQHRLHADQRRSRYGNQWRIRDGDHRRHPFEQRRAPGTSLGTLTNPASLATDGVYAFTTSGIPLEASTTYFVVFDSEGVINNAIQASISNTGSNDEDSTSASGWSISNGSLYRSWDSSGSWTSFSNSKRMRVNGTEATSTDATLEAFYAVERSGGILHHRIDVKLSKPVWLTPRDMRNHAFDVTNGTIVKAKRIHTTRLSYGGQRRTFSNHWRLEIRPTDVDNAVTVALKGMACGLAGGMCTRNGESVGNTPSLTVGQDGSGPVTLSIADASANENDGQISFAITLSRASPNRIDIRFRTISGGTATEGVTMGPLTVPISSSRRKRRLGSWCRAHSGRGRRRRRDCEGRDQQRAVDR